MTTRKTTKKALLGSLLALVLCFAMLVGTTFAWFTDNEVISGNKITAGTLDLTVGETVLLNADYLWEPGFCAPFSFKLGNADSLWLKYELAFGNLHYGETEDAAEAATEFAGLESNITTVLDVYDSQGNLLGTVAELFEAGNFGDAATVSGRIAPKTDAATAGDAIAFTIKMREEAGNEYQGDWCKFDIIAKATQEVEETDGNGHQDYDADATYGVPVATEAELANALGNGQDVYVTEPIEINEPITVTGDVTIDLNANLDATLTAARPFELEDGASLTINAGDKAVKVGKYGLVKIAGNGDVTINNGKFTGNVDNGAFIKVTDTAADVNIVLNDVEYTDTNNDSFVINMYEYAGEAKITINGGIFTAKSGIQAVNADVDVKGATFNTTGVAFEISNSDAILDKVTINVDPGVTVSTAPAAFVAVSSNGYAKVTNSTFTGNAEVVYGVYSGGQIDAANNNEPAGIEIAKAWETNSKVVVDGKVLINN